MTINEQWSNTESPLTSIPPGLVPSGSVHSGDEQLLPITPGTGGTVLDLAEFLVGGERGRAGAELHGLGHLHLLVWAWVWRDETDG